MLAENVSDRACQLYSGESRAWALRAVCALRNQNGTVACDAYLKSIELGGFDTQSISEFASQLFHARFFPECIRGMDRIADSETLSLKYRLMVAEAHRFEQNYEVSLQWLESAVKVYGESSELLREISGVCMARNDLPAAERALERARALEPDSAKTESAMAAVRLAAGDVPGCQSAAKRSIELDDHEGLGYLTWAISGTAKDSDRPRIESLRSILSQWDKPFNGRFLGEFALAKALEDLREYEESAVHYEAANNQAYSWKFGLQKYNPEQDDRIYRGLIAAFRDSPLRIEESTHRACDPIFVVGMPRSGTTLVHQILASHGEVKGAGEQLFWPTQWHRAFDRNTGKFSNENLRELGYEFCRQANEMFGVGCRVVDKMPINFLFAGLIWNALPSAKIIHVTRNPGDTCFSIYATQNDVRLEWAHNRYNIVRQYQRYEEVMRYWSETLPKQHLLTLNYEELVSSPRTEVMKLLEWCELDWSESCLEPGRNGKDVFTPSAFQVRQPINKGSVGRFEPYRALFPEFDFR